MFGWLGSLSVRLRLDEEEIYRNKRRGSQDFIIRSKLKARGEAVD
jgi:hypothetical protein